MRAYLGSSLFAVCCLLLSSCGGGGGDTPAPQGEAVPISTEFTVTVDTPASLITAKNHSLSFISKAYADIRSNLSEHNFAAVWLDEKGKIQEQIEITNWKKLDNGGYMIKAGTAAQLNAVLLVNLFAAPTFTLGEAIPDHLFMVPLTSESIVVNLKSSLTYYALLQQVIENGNWGVFEETVLDPTMLKLYYAQEDLDIIADDLEATLLPKIGLQDARLSNLLSLSIVQSMLKGRMERFASEQAALKADILAILNDGYWTVGSFSSNDGSGILTEQMVYDGQITELGETRLTEYRWDKSGAEDIDMTEVFTYFSGSSSFGSDDIKRQVLTKSGDWVGLFDYLKVEVAANATMLLTDAALSAEDEAGMMLEAKFYPLSGKRIHNYLSGKENHYVTRYINEDAVFSDGAYGFYFTWHPENDTYLLCDNRNQNPACRISPQSQPDTYYTTLNDVLSSPFDPAITIEDVNGFRLTDNVIVEFIDDSAKTLRYWVNIAANNWSRMATSTWEQTDIFGKEMFRFEVPATIKQLADDYPFEQRNLFIVEDRGYVNIGENLLKDDTFRYSAFSNNAYTQMLSVTSRNNLPPFGSCDFGNSQQANEDAYLNAVTECGGDERFTTESVNNLVGQHLVQISNDGNVTAIILRDDNSWDYYYNTALQNGNREWTLTEQGYLKLTPDTDKPGDFDYWALTNFDYSQKILAVKVYSAESSSDSNEIYSLMTKEYAPDQLAVCTAQDSGWDQSTTTPITPKTLSQYQAQAEQCKVTWQMRTPRFTEAMLIGQDGELSDDRALIFPGGDNTSRYLKLSDKFQGDFFLGNYIDVSGCQFNIPIKWKIEEDGTLYYEAIGDSMNSMNEKIAITDTDGLFFAIKAFNHQTRWETDEALLYGAEDGEIWSDYMAFIWASDVPNVVHMGLLPDNPELPADGGPAAGTILNDGQECAPPAPEPEPTP